MIYKTVPKTGDSISNIGFGCMRLPGGQFKPDEVESIKLIQDAIEHGINYFDTGWPYHGGKSESILGKALQDGYRDKAFIADKLPHWLCKTREDFDYYLNAQLERLGHPYIDYYLIHALDKKLWLKVKVLGIEDFLIQAKKSGKVRHVGFSFHGPRDDFKTVVDGFDWDVCQIQFNILDEHDQAGIKGLEYAVSKNIGVIVMEPLRGGSLAGKLPGPVQKIYDNAPVKRTNVEWALRWVWNHPGVITVLSGMNNLDHVIENCKIASEAEPNSLTSEETDILRRAGDTFRSIMKVSCTGCQYCMPCPQKVGIPFAFTLYNNKYLFNQKILSKLQYVLQSGGLQGRDPAFASQCTSCGLCVKQCPQKIDIPAELKKIKKEFEGPLTRPMVFVFEKLLAMGGKKKKKAKT